MRKTVQILFAMLLSCLALFAVDGEVTTPVNFLSDSISVTLEYAPIHTVSFYKDSKQVEMPDGPTGGPIDEEEANQLEEGNDDGYDDSYTLRFYLSGKSNYAINDYPTMTVSWKPLYMVYPAKDEGKQVPMSVYVDTGWCYKSDTKEEEKGEYDGQWVDGNGQARDFKTGSGSGSTEVTIKGFAPEGENPAAIGEHIFSYKLVAAVSADAYKDAENGQYMSTITLNVTGP